MARTIAKDHDKKRQVIQETAARVFADIGFDRTSMNLLSKECGVSKAAIYHYYNSKDELLFDILKSHLSSLRDRVAKVTPKNNDPRMYLREVITEILLAYRGADDYHKVQTNIANVLPAEQQKELADYQRDLVSQVLEATIAVARPSITTDKKRTRAITMSIFGMLNWFYMWNTDQDDKAREQYANVVADIVLDGIC